MTAEEIAELILEEHCKTISWDQGDLEKLENNIIKHLKTKDQRIQELEELLSECKQCTQDIDLHSRITVSLHEREKRI